MKKKICFVVFILILNFFIVNKIYGYEKTSELDGDDNATFESIAYNSNGGYAVVGNTIDEKYGYIAIYNSDGEKINEKIINKQFTYLKSIIQTSDNSYIVIGKNSSNYSDALIAKYDSELNEIWENTYSGSKYEYYNSVIETKDGSIVATGVADEINGNAYPSKGLIVKYDKNGNQLWAKTEGGSSNDIFNSVIETSDNCYLVVGRFKSTDINGLNTNGNADAVIFKYNSDGENIWKKSYGGSSYDEFTSIVPVDDGYIMLGSTASNDIVNITNTEQWKCLIVKYDTNFNFLWNRGYESGQQSSFLSGIRLPNNNVIAVGETNTISEIQHGILIEYDNEGNIVYTQETNPNDDLRYNTIVFYNNKFSILEVNDTTQKSKIIQYVLGKEEEKKNDEIKNNQDVKNESGNKIENEVDSTIYPEEIPKAGIRYRTIIFILIIILLFFKIGSKKYNEFKDIK